MSCDTTNSPANPASQFPSASQMGTLATNLAVIWEEISLIQKAILAAASQCQVGGGKMSVVVGGNTPMTFIQDVETITVTSGGAGYVYDSPALVVVPPYNAVASGANLTPVRIGGSITSVTVAAGGTGYQPRNATLAVTTGIGTGAVLEPVVNAAGNITAVNITNGGSGYTTGDTITATRAVAPNPSYINAVFQILTVGGTGDITSVRVVTQGTGYQPSVSTVRVVSSYNNSADFPLGAGFQASVVTNLSGVITAVNVVNPGSGYVEQRPALAITNVGTGAQTQVNVTGGAITSIQVLNGGNNYVPPVTGTITNPTYAPAPGTPAVFTINVPVNTYGTTPTLYWQVWSGAATDKAIQAQLNQVVAYFKSLGYTIQIQTNPATTNTIQWAIYW